MYFLNCKINLSKWNFKPRLETEFWVKEAIRELKIVNSCLPVGRGKLKINILDIFAGSGCIGIVVLKNIKNSRVDFIDIDNRAAEQIKINLKLNKISSKRYKIYQSDLFKKIKRRAMKFAPSGLPSSSPLFLQSKNSVYDVIFANPPYVATNRIEEVQPSVLKYEPRKALFGGEKGLDIIKKFLHEAKKHLVDNSIIYMEFDPLQKEEIEKIFKKEKYQKWQFFKDQFGKWRWVKVIHT